MQINPNVTFILNMFDVVVRGSNFLSVSTADDELFDIVVSECFAIRMPSTIKCNGYVYSVFEFGSTSIPCYVCVFACE